MENGEWEKALSNSCLVSTLSDFFSILNSPLTTRSLYIMEQVAEQLFLSFAMDDEAAVAVALAVEGCRQQQCGVDRYGSTGAPADKDDPGVSSSAFTHHALGSEDAFREATAVAVAVAVAWPLPPPCHGGVWGRLPLVLHRPRRWARPPPLFDR